MKASRRMSMSTAAAYHLQATEMMFSCGMMLFGITPKRKKQRETTYRITLINMEVYTTPDYATKPKKPWNVLLRSTWLALSQCHLLNLYATMNNSSTKACQHLCFCYSRDFRAAPKSRSFKHCNDKLLSAFASFGARDFSEI